MTSYNAGDVPLIVELGGTSGCRLMMLCGFHVLPKFLFGRVLGLMSSQRGFEYW